MLNHLLKFCVALLSIALWCPSCQSPSSNSKALSTKKSESSIRMNIKDEPQTLDPRKARDLNSITLMKMLFEGLTRLDCNEKVDLALAEKVDVSPDLKTYTFTLRDAVWSNGDPITAGDFEYAWKMCLGPDYPSDTAFQMYPIKNAKLAKEGKVALEEVGIRALDANTLQVELESPTPYFLSLLASPPFFPVNEKIDRKDPQWSLNAANFVCNGPFSLNEWKHQDRLEVAKNHSYWDADQVKLSAIHLVMVQEETELMMFEKNELDWAGSPLSTLPLEAIKGLRNSSTLKTKEMLGTYFLRSNTEKAPFDHPKIRSAFAYAINRKAIVDHVTQGNQLPATGLVPTFFGLQKAPYFNDANVAMARQLFEEALSEKGLTKEAFPEVSLMYRAGERNHLIAQAIQQQWYDAFGIRIKLESLEGKVYFDRISKQDFHLASGSWIADFEDPVNFLEVFKYKSGGSNNTL
ncbi:MAG: peptide ABC transporter substrate-binding protein, partial [Verrucomicrobia bacterium]|nr:peptide ABC transporter substrate-binding protein [Verrucomicrobiota bacterium]